MSVTNQQIARILRELGGFYEIKNEPYKPRAYEKAAEAIESADREMSALLATRGVKGLLEIPGVGRGIAEHVIELLETGRLRKYEELKKQIPVNLAELTAIEGVGAKTVGVLYKKLGIRNLKDLQRAVATHKIAGLAGFGKKSEENIRRALGTYAGFERRYLIGAIYPVIEKLQKKLEGSGLFQRVMAAGSYRRRQETLGDIDILAVSPSPRKAMDFFVSQKGNGRRAERGQTKAVIALDSGIHVDLRIVPEQSWGAAAQYFTGDVAHNIKMRKIAIAKGLKLSEYGISRVKNVKIKMKNDNIKSQSEQDIYRSLGMEWIPPELRTDSGEIEAAQANKLPKLIQYGDVRGDLQIQTGWTDGNASIDDMARAAKELGREYIAITDHTKSLAMTGGLDERKLMRQGKEIDKLNAAFRLRSGQNSFRILKGAEVNILKDGKLDIDDKTLARLDVVGVSVHSHFKLSREAQTSRIIRAISNPHADILFHPTTRVIQKRPPIDFDFGAVLRAAKKYRVALEINAHPQRLDLPDKFIRQAVGAGVRMVIDTDAHTIKELDYLHFGIAQARRGWAKKSDVLNTKSVEELLKYFK